MRVVPTVDVPFEQSFRWTQDSKGTSSKSSGSGLKKGLEISFERTHIERGGIDTSTRAAIDLSGVDSGRKGEDFGREVEVVDNVAQKFRKRLSRSASVTSVGVLPLQGLKTLEVFDTPEEGLSSTWQDIAHDVQAMFLLLSVLPMILPSLFITVFVYYILCDRVADGAFRDLGTIAMLVLLWGIALTLFFGPMVRLKSMVVALLGQLASSFGIVALILASVPVLSVWATQSMEAASFALGTTVFSTLMFKLHGHVPLKDAVLFGGYAFPVSFANVSVFVWYYAGSKLVQYEHWLVELAILGIGYPFFAAFSGRMLIAGFGAFLCYAYTSCNQLEAFHFFVRFAKMLFFMVAQTVLFEMTDRKGYVVASFLNILFETTGLYVQARVATSRWVEFPIERPATNIFQRWLKEETRIGHKQKFACFYFNECMTEKVGCFAVVMTVFCLQILNNIDEIGDPFGQPDAFVQIAKRGLLLFLFEFLEDYLKKQVIKQGAGVSISHIKPSFTVRESFLMGQFVSIAFCLILLGRNLLDSHFPHI